MITTLELISQVNGVSEDEPNHVKGIDFCHPDFENNNTKL